MKKNSPHHDILFLKKRPTQIFVNFTVLGYFYTFHITLQRKEYFLLVVDIATGAHIHLTGAIYEPLLIPAEEKYNLPAGDMAYVTLAHILLIQIATHQ